VGKSTAVSELTAVSEATSDVEYVRALISELLGTNVPTSVLRNDNMPAVRNVTCGRLGNSQRAAWVEACHVYEALDQGWLSVEHVATGENIADIFTKPLPRTAFYRHSLSLSLTHGMGVEKRAIVE
jgi:hypothetical protein